MLLGDLLELRHGPVYEALDAAGDTLAAIGSAMAGKEIVLVPGNHDHALAAPWLERRGRDGWPPALGLAEAFDARPGELLGRVARALGPAELRASYPGVWLRDDVWATHGHYLDVLFTVPTFERLAAGVMHRMTGPVPDRGARPDDFERVLGPIYAWVQATAQHTPPATGTDLRQGASARVWTRLSRSSSHRPLRSFLLRTSFGAAIAAVNRSGIGPVRADVSGAELRRAGLRAMGGVAERLGVPAEHVIFGHTHRSGPWDRDELREWRSPAGTRLWNTGSWVWEGVFLDTARSDSPYWPGSAIRVDAAGPPRPVRLLEDVSAGLLRRGPA